VTIDNLIRSVGGDLRRHWRHTLGGGLGIAVSIAALTFFLALGLGVRSVLLDEIFVLDRIEVQPRSTELNLLAVSLELGKDTLDETKLGRLEAIDGVAAVYPKMRLLAPAMGSGGEGLIGAGMQTELVADGIDPALVADEVGDAFHDPLVDPAAPGSRCTDDTACPDGSACLGATAFAPGECREVIPAIVSEHMVELYNGAFRRAYRLPKVNPAALIGLGLDVRFGASSLRPGGQRVLRHRVELVGFSDAAIPLGITLPLGFVRGLNRAVAPPGSADGFHSAVLEVDSAARAATVIDAAEALGLEARDGGARRAALIISILLAVVAVVGLVILSISALHVMHVFALLTTIRRREIGVLRSVGASRADIRLIVLAQAAVVGMLAGGAGVASAAITARVVDLTVLDALPDIAVKPDTLFAFEPWLIAASLAAAVLFCLLGALGPALRATGPDPAEVLTS
jgi:hypothetical protein